MSLLNSASLCVTPNAYKEGTLYSVIPNTTLGDMTVVRATTATRVNSAGLIELVPYNLVQYSEQFNNTLVWLPYRTSVTANAIISPNGTLTAENITEDTNNGTHEVAPTSAINANIGVSYAASFFFKAGTRTRCSIILDGNAFDLGGAGKAIFNLSTGAIISTSGGATATIENVGNGWYRCAISKVAANISGFTYFQMINDSNQEIYVGNGTSFFSVWGAQLNEGTLLPYQKTETRLNIPRIDYSNGTCPSLLVEPQRTNLMFPSENFTDINYAAQNCTITANDTTSPDGTQNADKLITTSTSLENQIRFGAFSILGNIGSSYTTTVFAKKGTGNFLRIRNLYVNNGASGGNAWFNINTGVVGTVESSQIASIKDMGNGWYRCSLTGVVGITSALNLIDIGLSDADNTTIPTANVNAFIWGGQLEAGSYATSYIPTTSAAVTRNADVISKTGISSLIGQTEGTIFLDFYYNYSDSSTQVLLKANQSNDANSVGIELQNNTLSAIVNSSGSNIATLTNTISIGRIKCAIAYKSNDMFFYVNGVQVGSDTSGTINFAGNVAMLTIGHFNLLGTLYFQSSRPFNSAILFPTRLTNAELISLTTI